MGTPEDVNRAFSPIVEVVEQFAKERSFRLDKCVRGNSGWELIRPHDHGGDIYLLLLYDERLGLGVGSVWQYPCPEMALLYSHFRAVRPCVLQPDAVTTTLGSEFQLLAQVPFGWWTHIRPLQSGAGSSGDLPTDDSAR
jgi:hypothetical protein